jgi:eukaryotic-like serine/threonine-protein kinase
VDPGFLLDGRYRLERRLARHGRTQVWCGRDALLERRVAVTFLAVTPSEGALRDRVREATRAAASPAHPCAVTTYDYGEAEGTDGGALMYVVSEFLSGETLARRLARGLLAPQDAVEVCARVAEALAAAHACGTVHGALTSSEVFLTADGARLLGFGPAGALVRAGAGAPEASGGPGDDVRALGGVLAECLTGDPDGDVARSPDGVAGLVARCSDAGAGAARPSAADAARVLAASAGGPPTGETGAVPAEGEQPAAPESGRPRARRAAVVGGACAAVLALALLPLLMIVSSLRDAPADVAVPLPSRPASKPPLGSVDGPAGRPPAGRTPGAAASPAVSAGAARAVAVSALARMRRSIDVGMATGEVRPRFGAELATLVTTLLDEVDGGTRVDLGRRVAGLRSALAGRVPGDVAPARAAGLGALLAEVPVPS